MGLRVDQADGIPFLCEDMRNTIPHGTCANDGDIFHMAIILVGLALASPYLKLIVVAEIASFPGVDKVSPGHRVEDILRRRLPLVVVAARALP